ncbi:MAG: CCA tRNA nucleotidyltransferase [Clostridia bacterium]|nr:CCA tRNA nucleotidyltransferase [Clostridia bacterium]
MTYIEFFVPTAVENVCACLSYAPKRVIYIADNSELVKKHIANYERVFKDRGEKIEFSYKTYFKNKLESAVEVITNIVESYDDCVFGITGGDEILNLALGIVYSKHPDKNIQIHRFNLNSNAVYDCDKDGVTVYKDIPLLSVKENIRIYGGDIVYGDIFEDKTYKWNFSPDFERDIDNIWSACRGNVRYWNTFIGCLRAIETVGSVICQKPLTTSAKKCKVKSYLEEHNSKYTEAKGLKKFLKKHGLICNYYDDGETLTVSYKNHQVKKCLTKAGQALEMKMFKTAKKALDDNGNHVYNDALNGVVIDWDGQFHDEKTQGIYDTENEIDIFLMHGVVPVFVSCKNGVVTSDELYKLNTVAKRFGGDYSKKVLIATSISNKNSAGEYLRQRAIDMDIKILENVQNMEDDALENELKKLWNNKEVAMIKIPTHIEKVLNILYKNGFEAYLVGGCVRDALMGKEPHDFDLTTNATPNEMLKVFEGMKIIETGLKHGTVTVVSDGENVEITTYRIDGKYTDNRHPEEVLFTRNIHEDLSRRDFTVNAIAYSPKDGIVDIFEGNKDILNRIIKCVGNPDARFNEDGLRIIRALRFASVLGFSIDEKTSISIHNNKELLKNISAERIFTELKKLICGIYSSKILNEYYDVFSCVFPLLLNYREQYFKNIKLIDTLPHDVSIRFSALFGMMNKDDIKSCVRLLKPDNKFYSNVKILSDYLTKDIKTDEISVRYIMNKLEEENILRLAKLKKIFYPEFPEEEFIVEYKHQLEIGACVKVKELCIKGNDLIDAGIEKGKVIGDIIDKLLCEVIENRCPNTKNELLEMALSLYKEMGL